jgi:hypothetical protein
MSRVNRGGGSEWSGASSSAPSVSKSKASSSKSNRTGISQLLDKLSLNSRGSSSSKDSNRSRASVNSTASSKPATTVRSSSSTASVLSGRSERVSQSSRRAPDESLGLGTHRDDVSQGSRTSAAAGSVYAEWQAMQQRRRSQQSEAGSTSSSQRSGSVSSSRRFKPGSLSGRMSAAAERSVKSALGLYKPAWTPSGDLSQMPSTPPREGEYVPDLNQPEIAFAAHVWDPARYPDPFAEQ